MRWRVVVAVVLALVLGAAGGWFYADSQSDPVREEPPKAIAVAPVLSTPSLPVVVAKPDPDDPPLVAGIELEPTRLTLPEDGQVEGQPFYQLMVPVPVGWKQTFNGVSRWYYTVPGNSDGSYGLRVEIIADQERTIQAAIDKRTAQLESSAAQGFMSDLDITPSTTGGAGFMATFIDDNGFRRVNIERFFEGQDGRAFATVAAYGRTTDENGMRDLVARMTAEQTNSTQNP